MPLSVNLTAKKLINLLEALTEGKINLVGSPTISIAGAASTSQIEALAVTLAKVELFTGAWFVGTDSGTANAHAVAITSGATNWVTGGLYCYLANAANTGAVTLAVTPSGGGGAWTAKTIKKLGDQDLVAGDVRAGHWVVVRYDGTSLQLLNPVSNPAHRYGTAAGSSNAFTLTTAPTVTAYAAIAGVPIQFKANHSIDGATTLNVDGLGAKAVVKDNNQALVTGDILTDQVVQVVYDTTLDKFVMTSPSPAGNVAGIRGNSRGLVIANNGSNPTYQLDVDADEVTLKDGSDAEYLAKDVDLTLDISVSGANGLMTGQTEATSTWYEVWVIYNPVDNLKAGLLIAAGTAEGSHALPTNYTYKAFLGYVYNDSGSDFDTTYQRGRDVWLPEANVMTAQTGSTSYTTVSLAAFVPPGAKSVSGTMGCSTTPSSSDHGITVAGDGNGLGAQSVHVNNQGASDYNSFRGAAPFTNVPLKTAQTLHWKSDDTSPAYRLNVSGYTL